MLLLDMKMYLLLLWGISALFIRESISASIPATSNIDSTTEPNKTAVQLVTVGSKEAETPSETQQPTYKPAEAIVSAAAETTVETEEAVTTDSSSTSDGSVTGLVFRITAAVNISSASARVQMFTAATTGNGDPSLNLTTTGTAKPTEGQLHQQSGPTSTDVVPGTNSMASTWPDVPSSTRPDVPSSTRPDVPSSTRPDIPSSTRPDVPSSTRPDIPSSTSPDVPSSTSPDVPSTTSPDVPSTRRPDIPSSTSPDFHSTTSPDVPSSTSPDVPSTTSPDVPSSTSPDFPSTTSPDVPSSTSPDVPSSMSPDVPYSTSPDVPSTTSPDVPSTTRPGVPSTAEATPEPTSSPLTTSTNHSELPQRVFPTTNSTSSSEFMVAGGPNSTPDSSNTTTAATSTGLTGIFIPRGYTVLPIPANKPTHATTKTTNSPPITEAQPCFTRGVVMQCLIVITSLAVLATIFMVSTIVLCVKLSERKYKVKKPQQDTEMMCISSLLPEKNYSYTRQRNPVPNGVLVIHSGLDSEDDGGDNLTLSSFLPDNDRFV